MLSVSFVTSYTVLTTLAMRCVFFAEMSNKPPKNIDYLVAKKTYPIL